MVRMTLSDALARCSALLDAGRTAEADALCGSLDRQWPGEPGILHLWGVIAYQQQQVELAAARFGAAWTADPRNAEIGFCLSIALKQLGRPAEAEKVARQATEANPAHAGAWRALGLALHNQGAIEQALAAYRRSLAIDPASTDTLCNFGLALQQIGEMDEAEQVLKEAVRFEPQHTGAWLNLGVVCSVARRWHEAIEAYQRVLAREPSHVQAARNLGNVLYLDGQWTRAAEVLRQVLNAAPDLPEVYGDLANVYLALGLPDDADALFRRALQRWPQYAPAYGAWVATQVGRLEMTAARLKEIHAGWERTYGEPLRAVWRPHPNDRRPDRPLRLGFISSDFGRHPVGYFSIRALEGLARQGCEMVLYTQREVAETDTLTRRFQALATHWRPILRLDDEAAAEQIRADAVDILFDLNGHTAGSRLPVFARKPAPLQVTWLGYEGTTGLQAIDFLLADRFVIPHGEEADYVEHVLRMPGSYVTFDPPDFAPAVGPPPQTATGRVTLGSFNKPSKITPPVMEAWIAILRQLPQARLLLKFDGWRDVGLRGRFLNWFAREGIDTQRVELRGWSSHAETLAAYNEVDLALDTYPFSGSATTCDALWMGVPVITRPGATFVSRHTATHLANLGLEEMIADDWPAYVRLVVQWATDLPRLAALRAELRTRMAGSVLCDGDRFATDLLALLRPAWRAWAAGT